MQADQKLKDWLYNPYPLWNSAVSESLTSAVVSKNELESYSLEKSLNGHYNPEYLVPFKRENISLLLELPADSLKAFYDEHGLYPIFFFKSQIQEAIDKLNNALDVIKLVEPAYSDILSFVKTIQVIQSENSETDISYSHPKIPFSIFLSLCDDNSSIANLRVAESIIHEAMHLKLTLIEKSVPLVKAGSNIAFYSPWRDEERPVRGVLHGLFVFRALLDFFKQIKYERELLSTLSYIENRVNKINAEINFLESFPNSVGLTPEGCILVKNLLLI